MSKKKGLFRKNVVEKKWAVGYRNGYGEDEVLIVAAESEEGAILKVPAEYEVVTVEEYEG